MRWLFKAHLSVRRGDPVKQTPLLFSEQDGYGYQQWAWGTVGTGVVRNRKKRERAHRGQTASDQVYRSLRAACLIASCPPSLYHSQHP